jgi:hypothetical protein
VRREFALFADGARLLLAAGTREEVPPVPVHEQVVFHVRDEIQFAILVQLTVEEGHPALSASLNEKPPDRVVSLFTPTLTIRVNLLRFLPRGSTFFQESDHVVYSKFTDVLHCPIRGS